MENTGIGQARWRPRLDDEKRQPEKTIPGWLPKGASMTIRILFLTLLLLVSASAQPWLNTKLLVVPGKSLGPIVLGKPIPEEAFALLGPGTGRAEVSKNEHKDGAGVDWLAPNATLDDPYIRAKCHDGIHPENVYQIFWSAPNPRTAEGLGVGSPQASVLKAYPEGRWTTDSLDGYPTWQTPGLNWTFDEDRSKVIEMHLRMP
jgi:hypothetical protein